ncbi:MAG: hypothetical protein J7559_00425, partial [Cohnella sp.]|nr:hypothetical protein [Cohnella sp.]
FQWFIDGDLVDQNELSGDVVEAGPHGFGYYFVFVKDKAGRGAIYPVYIYQGTPDIQPIEYVRSIDESENFDAWSIYLSYDPETLAWGTPFRLQLPAGLTAELVDSDNPDIVLTPDGSGYFVLEGTVNADEFVEGLPVADEKKFDVKIKVSGTEEAIATYTLMVKIYHPSA